MSLSPLQQHQQQQVSQLLNFNQLTIQTNDYNQQQQHNLASSLFSNFQNHKQTTSPLNNLLNTSPILNQLHPPQLTNCLNDEEMSTSSSSSSSTSGSSSSGSSTHSISSSNSSIKDDNLLALSPMMISTHQQQQQQQLHQQRNINTLLSSVSLLPQQHQLNDQTSGMIVNKCDLCKDFIINNTKVLFGCYHVYCSSCIERLQQVASSPSSLNTSPSAIKQSIITCPLCSQDICIVETSLPQQQHTTTTTKTSTNNDINDYPSNGSDFSLINLLNENKIKSVNNNNTNVISQQQQRCKNCKSNDSLIQKCFSCYNQLCHNCLLTHQYTHYFDLKDLILESPLLSQNQQNERLVICFKHKNEQIKYFCMTCNQLLCKECVLSEPHQLISHPNAKQQVHQHEFGLINDIGLQQTKKLAMQLDYYRVQLQTILNNNDNNNNLFNHQNHNHNQQHAQNGNNGNNEHNIEQLVGYLNKNYQKAMSEIDSMHQYYKQLLDERKQELKNELDSIYNSKQLLINNLQLMSKNDENLNNIKFKIENIINFTQRLMKNTSTNSSSLNELLLIKKPIEQKLQLLLQQLALIGNDMNLNKFNKDLFNIEFVANYSPVHTQMYSTFGHLKASTNNDLTAAITGVVAGITNNNNSNGYKPKPIGPPVVGSTQRHTSPKLTDFGFHDGIYKTTATANGQNLHFNELLTFDAWSNGINNSSNSTNGSNTHSNANDINSLLTNANDLSALQAEQLLELSSANRQINSTVTNNIVSSTKSSASHNTNGSSQNSNNNLLPNSNGNNGNSNSASSTCMNPNSNILITTNNMMISHHHLQPSNSILPARSQLKRQKMIYNCKFGEFGINDGQFTEPSGVAINQNNDIIVADTNSHRIQIFDRDGHFKFKFGECGKREGQLLYPNRVSIVKQTGDIIVTERSPTHQIQIYNQYGNFVRKFGANILQHPRGVCVDSKGNIIVVECKVMRVIIFDQYGNVVHKFSCSKYLEFPNGVCVNDRQEIFISDNRAHCIKVFNYDGQFLRQIGGEGVTNYPIGVGINTNGEVLVADNHNNFNLTVFSQDGQLINALESKVKHAQCFDVGLMDDGSIVLASKDYRIYVYRYISNATHNSQSPNTSHILIPSTGSTSNSTLTNTTTTTTAVSNSLLQ